MHVLAMSDLHGQLPKVEETFDLLLICGDVCPIHDQYFAFQKEWVLNDFVDWINTLPFHDEYSKVVMVGGNHDFVFERYGNKEKDQLKSKTNGRCIFLKNNEYDFEWVDDNGLKSIKIFGTSYCKIFGNWAFMLSDEKLKARYDLCTDNVDIFISHDSPDLNGLGTIHYTKVNDKVYGQNVGNKVLTEAIKIKKPKYFFSGHIHTGNHDFENIDGTKMANVSLLNEQYLMTYPILSFDFE